MNNVEMARKREELGLVTIRDPDPNSEAEIVVQTKQVDAEAYRNGLRYIYAVTSLYTLRALFCVGRYLSQKGTMQYADLFRAFVKFWGKNQGHPYVKFCEESISKVDYSKFDNIGTVLHMNLHAERESFDELLVKFMVTQPFWRDPAARFFFEIDLVNRPYVYKNTKIVPKPHRFTRLREVTVTPEGYVVEIPPEHAGALGEYLSLQGGATSATRFEVIHRRSQLPYMPAKSLQEHYSYCQDVSQRMGSLLPIWRPSSGATLSAGSAHA
jgi:hypothetical protein